MSEIITKSPANPPIDQNRSETIWKNYQNLLGLPIFNFLSVLSVKYQIKFSRSSFFQSFGKKTTNNGTKNHILSNGIVQNIDFRQKATTGIAI